MTAYRTMKLIAIALLIHGISMLLLQALTGANAGLTVPIAAGYAVMRTLGTLIMRSELARKLICTRSSDLVGTSFKYMVFSIVLGLICLYITGAVFGFSLSIIAGILFALVMVFVEFYLVP